MFPLTEAIILFRIAIVVVDLVATLAVFAEDALRGADAVTALLVAAAGLGVASAGLKHTATAP